MLTTPDNLLFLHLLNDDLQNELLHHLSRDGGEVDQPIIPSVLFLALFEDWSDSGFPPVLGHLSCPPGPFKNDGEWVSNDNCQLPQHSWVHSIAALCIYGCPVCLNYFSHNLPQPSKGFHFSRLLLSPPGTGMPSVTTEAKKAFSNSHFPLSSVCC